MAYFTTTDGRLRREFFFTIGIYQGDHLTMESRKKRITSYLSDEEDLNGFKRNNNTQQFAMLGGGAGGVAWILIIVKIYSFF